jgi:hypothetical protein
MPTTARGIYYPDTSTNITPLETVLATMATSVDTYLSANATIHTIANTAARAALVSAYSPTVSNPLFAWRQDAAAGNNLEYTTNGTTWLAYGGKPPYFSTTSARDTAIPSPVVGMQASTGTGSSIAGWIYDGSVWVQIASAPTAWTAYTPTFTGLTLGNGVVTGAYQVVGKTVNFRCGVTWGSTTAATGVWFPSVPVTALSNFTSPTVGFIFDNSAVLWNACTYVPGSYLIAGASGRINATIPWTWAVGDIVEVSGTYEAA